MAATQHERAPVSEEVVREHLANWNTFTHFVKYGIGAVVVVLILMYLFLI